MPPYKFQRIPRRASVVTGTHSREVSGIGLHPTGARPRQRTDRCRGKVIVESPPLVPCPMRSREQGLSEPQESYPCLEKLWGHSIAPEGPEDGSSAPVGMEARTLTQRRLFSGLKV